MHDDLKGIVDVIARVWKGIFDVAAVSVAWGAVSKALPPIAALFSIIWISIQIYDRIKRGPRQ